MKSWALAILLLFSSCAHGTHTTRASTTPSQLPTIVANWDLVKSIVDSQYTPLVERFSWMGISVGVIRGGEVRYYSYGHADGKSTPITEDTVFAINSMTKAFTGTVLAELVNEKKIALADSVQEATPSHHIPQFGKKEISFLDLATHTSGLPRVPDNLLYPKSLDPYRDYTDEMFFSFLSGFQFTGQHPIGTHYLYSNLGFGLLGYSLAQVDHKSFSQMIHDRVAAPLSLVHTTSELNPTYAPLDAVGHDGKGNALPPREGPETLAGSFAVRSTAADITKFLSAYLSPPNSEFGKALELAQSPERSQDEPGWKSGLGWEIREASGSRFKDGGGGGFNSVMFFNRSRQTAIVVLSNSDFQNGEGIEQGAWNIFTPLRK